jgi:hypothetical protein
MSALVQSIWGPSIARDHGHTAANFSLQNIWMSAHGIYLQCTAIWIGHILISHQLEGCHFSAPFRSLLTRSLAYILPVASVGTWNDCPARHIEAYPISNRFQKPILGAIPWTSLDLATACFWEEFSWPILETRPKKRVSTDIPGCSKRLKTLMWVKQS